MNEPQFGKKVRLLLNQRLGVDATVAARLSAARERALARQRPEPGPVVAFTGNVLERFEGWGGLSLRILLPLALLVGGLAGIYSWEQNQRIAEIEDIDAQLLTDELPIDAYLDRGFQRWLKKRETEQ